MTRFYIDPDILGTIPIDGLTSKQTSEAIDERCRREHINEATEQAAQLLRAAGLDVDDESLARLRKLVE